MKQKAITLILTLIAILAPLLIMPSKDDWSYNIPKLVVLLVTGTVLLILLLSSYKTLTFDKKDIIILIFMGLVLISTYLSSDIKVSIIGKKNRYEGLLMLATYIIIYLCSKKYFKYEKVSMFLNIMFLVSMVIGIIGIAQQYVSNTELYPIFNKGICATFGNSNFFGSFISIVLPIAVSVFILFGSKRCLILSLVMFFNLISSGTRSAWLAFVFVGVLGLIYLIVQRDKKYFQRAIVILIFFILIFVYLINGFDFFVNILRSKNENNKKNNIIPNQEVKTTTSMKIETIKHELKQSKDTGNLNQIGSGRIEIWKMTLKVIKNKPIFGCGPDNLTLGLFQICKEDAWAFALRTRTIADKAHNEYLQIASTIGVPALICYLIFVGLILFPKVRLVLSEKKYFIICLSLISYFVQAFFNISTIGVAPLLWLLLGLVDNKEFINKLDNKQI